MADGKTVQYQFDLQVDKAIAAINKLDKKIKSLAEQLSKTTKGTGGKKTPGASEAVALKKQLAIQKKMLKTELLRAKTIEDRIKAEAKYDDALNEILEKSKGLEDSAKKQELRAKVNLEIAKNASSEKKRQVKYSKQQTSEARRLAQDLQRSVFAITAITGAIAVPLTIAIKNFAKLERQVREYGTLINATDGQIKGMTRSLLDMASDKVGKPVEELANSIYLVRSATIDTAYEMEFLETATKAAIGGRGQVSDSVNLLARSMNTFGIEAERATEVADAWLTAVKYGMTTTGELGQYFGKSAVMANNLGVSLDSLAAAFATTTRGGFNTADASTALMRAMNELAKPSDKTRLILEKLGVTTGRELVEKTGSLQGALQELAKAVNYNEEAMSQMFGRIRGRLGIFALVGRNAIEASKDLVRLNEKAGNTEEMFGVVNDSLQDNTQKMRSSVARLSNSLVEMWVPAMNAAVKATGGLMDAVTKLNDSTKLLSAGLVGGAGIITALGGLGVIVHTLGFGFLRFGLIMREATQATAKMVENKEKLNALLRTGNGLANVSNKFMAGLLKLLGAMTHGWGLFITLSIAATFAIYNWMAGMEKAKIANVEFFTSGEKAIKESTDIMDKEYAKQLALLNENLENKIISQKHYNDEVEKLIKERIEAEYRLRREGRISQVNDLKNALKDGSLAYSEFYDEISDATSKYRGAEQFLMFGEGVLGKVNPAKAKELQKQAGILEELNNQYVELNRNDQSYGEETVVRQRQIIDNIDSLKEKLEGARKTAFFYEGVETNLTEQIIKDISPENVGEAVGIIQKEILSLWQIPELEDPFKSGKNPFDNMGKKITDRTKAVSANLRNIYLQERLRLVENEEAKLRIREEAWKHWYEVDKKAYSEFDERTLQTRMQVISAEQALTNFLDKERFKRIDEQEKSELNALALTEHTQLQELKVREKFAKMRSELYEEELEKRELAYMVEFEDLRNKWLAGEKYSAEESTKISAALNNSKLKDQNRFTELVKDADDETYKNTIDNAKNEANELANQLKLSEERKKQFVDFYIMMTDLQYNSAIDRQYENLDESNKVRQAEVDAEHKKLLEILKLQRAAQDKRSEIESEEETRQIDIRFNYGKIDKAQKASEKYKNTIKKLYKEEDKLKDAKKFWIDEEEKSLGVTEEVVELQGKAKISLEEYKKVLYSIAEVMADDYTKWLRTVGDALIDVSARYFETEKVVKKYIYGIDEAKNAHYEFLQSLREIEMQEDELKAHFNNRLLYYEEYIAEKEKLDRQLASDELTSLQHKQQLLALQQNYDQQYLSGQEYNKQMGELHRERVELEKEYEYQRRGFLIRVAESTYDSLLGLVQQSMKDFLAAKIKKLLTEQIYERMFTKFLATEKAKQGAIEEASAVKSISTSIAEATAKLTTSIASALSGVLSWMFNNPFTMAAGAAAIAAAYAMKDKIFGILSGAGKAVGLKDGTIVDKPTYAMIGEGNEPEIVAPKSTFKDFVGQLVGEMVSSPKPLNKYLQNNVSTNKSSTINFGNINFSFANAPENTQEAIGMADAMSQEFIKKVTSSMANLLKDQLYYEDVNNIAELSMFAR